MEKIQPKYCKLWDHSDCSGAPHGHGVYLCVARRGPQFINAAFKLIKFLERRDSEISRVMLLIQDEKTDDFTVS